MARRESKGTSPGEECCSADCCGSACPCRGKNTLDCCKVEAVVGVDSRGQMVLPKDLREKFGIAPDQKLAVLSWASGSAFCCITLQKADELAEVVRRTYGPLLSSAIHSE